MKTASLFLLLTGAALFAVDTASADKVPYGKSANAFSFKKKPIKQDDNNPSPNFGGVVAKNWKPEKWASFEVDGFDMSVRDNARSILGIGAKDLYMGPVVVSFYMHVKGPNKTTGRDATFLLKKEITYTDVPLNKPTAFVVYLSPITIANLTGGTGTVRPERMGYEIKYNGEIIHRWSDKKVDGNDDWWNIDSPSIIKESGKYPLLNKDETPFASCWYDRYPPIKKVDSTSLGETIDKLTAPAEEGEAGGTTPAPTTPATNHNRRNTTTTGGRTAPGGTPGV